MVAELSKMTSIAIQSDELNRYSISISGMLLVTGDTAYSMATEVNADSLYDVVWSHNGRAVEFTNGEIKGLMEMRMWKS